MSFFGSVLAFEKNKLGNMLSKYKKDPERLLLGINTPLESKLWGKVLGKDYTPTVDMWGGATKDDGATARDKGIDTGPGEKMHGAARAITAVFAGGYGIGKMAGASSAQAAGSGAEAAGAAGGASGAGAAGSAGSSTPWWKQLISNAPLPSAGGGRPAVRYSWRDWQDVQTRDVDAVDDDPDIYATSSKRAKTGRGAISRAALRQGLAGADPISTNGITMGAVKALARRLEALERGLASMRKEGR